MEGAVVGADIVIIRYLDGIIYERLAAILVGGEDVFTLVGTRIMTHLAHRIALCLAFKLRIVGVAGKVFLHVDGYAFALLEGEVRLGKPVEIFFEIGVAAPFSSAFPSLMPFTSSHQSGIPSCQLGYRTGRNARLVGRSERHK